MATRNEELESWENKQGLRAFGLRLGKNVLPCVTHGCVSLLLREYEFTHES